MLVQAISLRKVQTYHPSLVGSREGCESRYQSKSARFSAIQPPTPFQVRHNFKSPNPNRIPIS